jgi:hypothetical protein
MIGFLDIYRGWVALIFSNTEEPNGHGFPVGTLKKQMPQNSIKTNKNENTVMFLKCPAAHVVGWQTRRL